MTPTEILEEGVRLLTVRPWRRTVTWSEVEAIMQSDTWDPNPGLSLRLTGGELIPLSNVPVDRAAAMAALSGSPVERQHTARVPLAKPAVVRDLHDSSRSSDPERRFTRVEEQQRQLQQQLTRPVPHQDATQGEPPAQPTA